MLYHWATGTLMSHILVSKVKMVNFTYTNSQLNLPSSISHAQFIIFFHNAIIHLLIYLTAIGWDMNWLYFYSDFPKATRIWSINNKSENVMQSQLFQHIRGLIYTRGSLNRYIKQSLRQLRFHTQPAPPPQIKIKRVYALIKKKKKEFLPHWKQKCYIFMTT